MSTTDSAVADRLRHSDATRAMLDATRRRDEQRARYARTEDEREAFQRGLEVGDTFARCFASREALSQAYRVAQTGDHMWATTLRSELAQYLRKQVDSGELSTMNLPTTLVYERWPEGRVFADGDAKRVDALCYGAALACAEVFEQVRES